MNVSTGDGYRYAVIDELHVEDTVEIYGDPDKTLSGRRFIRWHPVQIVSDTFCNPGKTVSQNRLKKLISAGKIRMKL